MNRHMNDSHSSNITAHPIVIIIAECFLSNHIWHLSWDHLSAMHVVNGFWTHNVLCVIEKLLLITRLDISMVYECIVTHNAHFLDWKERSMRGCVVCPWHLMLFWYRLRRFHRVSGVNGHFRRVTFYLSNFRIWLGLKNQWATPIELLHYQITVNKSNTL